MARLRPVSNWAGFRRRAELDEQTEMLLKQFSVPAKRSKEEAWAALNSAIASQPKTKRRWLTPTITWTVAASFALLVAVGSLIMTHTTHVASAKGEHLAVVLPDGSNVLLNSESQLSYQKYMWWRKREVTLKGEGYFKVMKGRRFEVRTGKFVTSVLGTTFNVFARDNEVRVCCFTGKVGVREVTSGSHTILTPGLGVGSDGNTLGSVEKISEKQKGWTKGEFYFTDVPLDDVFAEIERQFDQEHEFKAFASHKVGRLNFSAAWIYGSGKPWDELALYNNLKVVPDYERNSRRLGSYHRLDLSASYEQRIGYSLLSVTASIFNVYDKNNEIMRPYGFSNTSLQDVSQGKSPLIYNDIYGLRFTPSLYLNLTF